MSDTETVFGVYLDRFGGAIMSAKVLGTAPPMLEATHCIPTSWRDQHKGTVLAGIRHLAKMAKDASASAKGTIKLAISSPGPFMSLNHQNRSDGSYGTVHPKVGTEPMRGFNLPTEFKAAFQNVGGNPDRLRIEVYTDAQACAMGESVSRNLGSDSTLAFILATEGVGLGLVRGRTPIGSALHSEFGMMPVRWRGDDKLKPDKDENNRRYSQSLSQLAENGSVWKRISDNPVTRDLTEDDRDVLDHRAYYLAQGCLACAVMMAPHKIILGADLDYQGLISNMTLVHFRKFLAARKIDQEPVPDFPEINDPEYISNSKIIPNIKDIPPLHVTGALGLCHAAATMA